MAEIDTYFSKELLNELHSICIHVATEVGNILSDYFAPLNKSKLLASITTKTSPTDYATEADEQAELLARKLIKTMRPDDTILGEEQGEDRGTSDLIWVIDPLDGTTNFVYGIDAFAVSIAAALRPEVDPSVYVPGSGGKHGSVLAGVVYNPIREELFSGIFSGQPLLNGSEITHSAPDSLSRSLIGTGFGYDQARRSRQAAMLTKILPDVRDIRRFGSASLDLCSVAAGRLDGYFEVGLKPWDAAAGLLIADLAGSAVHETPTPEDGPMLIVSAPDISEDLTASIAASMIFT